MVSVAYFYFVLTILQKHEYKLYARIKKDQPENSNKGSSEKQFPIPRWALADFLGGLKSALAVLYFFCHFMSFRYRPVARPAGGVGAKVPK